MKHFTVLTEVLGMQVSQSVSANSRVEAVRDIRRRLINRMIAIQPANIKVTILTETDA